MSDTIAVSIAPGEMPDKIAFPETGPERGWAQ